MRKRFLCTPRLSGATEDEKALAALYELIEREEINYQDFQELKLAIESLGGEYEKERDFSNDKVYRKIMEQKKGMKS